MLEFVRDRRGRSAPEVMAVSLSFVTALMVLNAVYREEWSTTARLPAFGMLLPGWLLLLPLVGVFVALLYLAGKALDWALIRFDRAREQRRASEAE